MVFAIGGPGGHFSEVYVEDHGEDNLEDSDDVIHVWIGVEDGSWGSQVSQHWEDKEAVSVFFNGDYSIEIVHTDEHGKDNGKAWSYDKHGF